MDYPVLNKAPDVAAAVVPHAIDANGNAVAVSPARPLPVALQAAVGSIAWGAPTAVAATGASKQLIAANATRKALMIVNPVGNAQMSYDLSGGTVTLAGGVPLLAGDIHRFTGPDCPVGAVTFIGTNAQNLVYVEGA
jgi:hypothetical protein